VKQQEWSWNQAFCEVLFMELGRFASHRILCRVPLQEQTELKP